MVERTQLGLRLRVDSVNLTKTQSVVFVAHNRNDSAVKRRAKGFMAAGAELTGFMYRRDGDHRRLFEGWNNVDLGYVGHGQIFQRLGRHAGALQRIFRERKVFKSADIVYARNLDLLILSWLGLKFSRGKAQLIYECLDVHQVMTRSDWKGRIARAVERFMLRRIDKLVVSSPGFIDQYFTPVQGYTGKVILKENKLYLEPGDLLRPERASMAGRSEGPLVLVWVGILRCQKTLSILIDLAREMEGELIIRLHGLVGDNVISDFEQQISGIDNIQFCGCYEWPNGLAGAYKGAHFVWAQELEWKGANSSWLLPNRLYEASHQGVLSIAIAGTETATVVQERGLGVVFPESNVSHISKYLRSLDRRALFERQVELLGREEDEFVATLAEDQAFLDHISGVFAASKGALNKAASKSVRCQ